MGVYRKAFKPMFQKGCWKIVRGDTVMITSGKDKNKVGPVLKVLRDKQWPRVVVEGLNLVSGAARLRWGPGGEGERLERHG